jgi:hypothetical protein
MSQGGLFNSIYGPLGSEYCFYFYLLSVIGFVLFVLTLLFGIYKGLQKNKGSGFYLALIVASLGYGIFYFQNRLLYSMCAGSL